MEIGNSRVILGHVLAMYVRDDLVDPKGPYIRKDGERNCVSNIRRGGLSAEEAAFKIHWLLREAFRRRITGVQLKDESNFTLEDAAAPAPRQKSIDTGSA